MIKWKAHYGEMWEGLPVDVLPVSNGEFLPESPSEEQIAIMRIANQETERLRSKYNMPRREFVRTAAAFAAGLWGINQITGTEWGSYKAFAHNTLTNAACDLEFPHAQLNNAPGEFIFDVQITPRRSERNLARDEPGHRGVLRRVWPQAGSAA